MYTSFVLPSPLPLCIYSDPMYARKELTEFVNTHSLFQYIPDKTRLIEALYRVGNHSDIIQRQADFHKLLSQGGALMTSPVFEQADIEEMILLFCLETVLTPSHVATAYCILLALQSKNREGVEEIFTLEEIRKEFEDRFTTIFSQNELDEILKEIAKSPPLEQRFLRIPIDRQETPPWEGSEKALTVSLQTTSNVFDQAAIASEYALLPATKRRSLIDCYRALGWSFIVPFENPQYYTVFSARIVELLASFFQKTRGIGDQFHAPIYHLGFSPEETPLRNFGLHSKYAPLPEIIDGRFATPLQYYTRNTLRLFCDHLLGNSFIQILFETGMFLKQALARYDDPALCAFIEIASNRFIDRETPFFAASILERRWWEDHSKNSSKDDFVLTQFFYEFATRIDIDKITYFSHCHKKTVDPTDISHFLQKSPFDKSGPFFSLWKEVLAHVLLPRLPLQFANLESLDRLESLIKGQTSLSGITPRQRDFVLLKLIPPLRACLNERCKKLEALAMDLFHH